MLTENREFNEIYEQYKNLILKDGDTLIQAVIVQRKILLKTLF